MSSVSGQKQKPSSSSNSNSNSSSATATLLTEAKREYTKQIVSFLTTPLYDTLYVQWQKAVEEDASSPMQLFQDKLAAIAEWDEDEKKTECQRCLSESQCSYIDDLIAAVFIAHTKVLASIRNEETIREFQIEVPGSIQFIHECLVQCAREFWKSPYLFYQNEAANKISRIQIQKNLREAEGVIKEAIEDTIRKMLPVKEILQEYLEEGRETIKAQERKKEEEREKVKQSSEEDFMKPPKKSSQNQSQTQNTMKDKEKPVNQQMIENIRQQFENLSSQTQGTQGTQEDDKEESEDVSEHQDEDQETGTEEGEEDEFDGLENWTGDDEDKGSDIIQFEDDEPGRPLEEVADEFEIEDLTPENEQKTQPKEESTSSFIDEVLE
jgi:hypothetical protein